MLSMTKKVHVSEFFPKFHKIVSLKDWRIVYNLFGGNTTWDSVVIFSFLQLIRVNLNKPKLVWKETFWKLSKHFRHWSLIRSRIFLIFVIVLILKKNSLTGSDLTRSCKNIIIQKSFLDFFPKYFKDFILYMDSNYILNSHKFGSV